MEEFEIKNNNHLTKNFSKNKQIGKSNSKSKEREIRTEKSALNYHPLTSPNRLKLQTSPSPSSKLKEKESKLFKSLKDKTHPFFKNSLIDSCSHIIVKNGQTLAVPFEVRNSKGKKLSSYKSIPMKSSEQMSIYRKDFSVKPIIHAGMLNKPLEPYNPSSYRNRLPNLDYVISHKNKSSMEIGSPSSISRKQWVSTYKDSFKTPVFLPICNTGILSDISKKIHKKLNEI